MHDDDARQHPPRSGLALGLHLLLLLQSSSLPSEILVCDAICEFGIEFVNVNTMKVL